MHFNSVSPYKALPSIPDGFYEFIMDFDVRYSIGFMFDDSIITIGAYQFNISNVNNQVSGRALGELKQTLPEDNAL